MLEHDPQIIQDIRKGREEPFRQIFNAYYESLCQYAFTILRNMDEAEDIVQAMFLKIWEKRQTLVTTHTNKSYLYKAVYHQCINQFDHRAVREKYKEHSTLESASEVQHPEVFPNELEESIMAAINSLPKQCRTIFMMSRYQELKYSEIAKKLNISVNTIENQIITFHDTWRFSAGYMYKGNPDAVDYLGAVSLRTGFYVQNYYLNLKGNDLPSWGMSLGISIPMFDNRSSINLTYSFDQLGTLEDGLILQKSQKIMLDVIIRDIWGIKRKFD